MSGPKKKTHLLSPKEKERAVQAMFTSIASYYDLNNTLLSFGLHHRWKRETIRTASLKEGNYFLDVGAGTADLSLLAANEIGEKGGVVAIDLNRPMLQIGREKLTRQGGHQTLCIQGNAELLPLPDLIFDAVVSGFCIRNVSDLHQTLKEMLRVLKPNGRIVLLEFSRPTSAILRWLYDFYSFTLLPKIGAWVSQDQTGVYQYLPDSIRRFPDQETLVKKMEAIGFKEVSYRNLSGGIIALHTGKKQK